MANATYYAEVEISIKWDSGPEIRFRTTAGFTAGMDGQGIGLLGGAGFFDSYRVLFDYKSQLLHIQVR
jgi:hypothetical protein